MGWQRLPQPSHVSTGVLKETPTMIGTRKVRDLAPLSTGLVWRRALEETSLATRSGRACRKSSMSIAPYGDLQCQDMDVLTRMR